MAQVIQVWFVTALGILAPSLGAAQQSQGPAPDQPMRLLIGFPAGSNTDLVGRVLADALRERLGRSVTVENRPGAGGSTAIEAMVRAAPDGTTLALAASNLVIAGHVSRNLTYDPQGDLTPISLFATAPIMVLVTPNYPARDLAGLGRALRENRATCGTPGAGSFLHLATVLVTHALGAECTVTHYPDNATGVEYLRTGRLQIFVTLLPAAISAVREGAGRPLAVGSSARHALAPDVPTVAETLPGFEASALFPLVAPRGVQDADAERLERAVMEAARDTAVASRLRALGAEPIGSSRGELAAALQAADLRWGEAARAAGVTGD